MTKKRRHQELFDAMRFAVKRQRVVAMGHQSCEVCGTKMWRAYEYAVPCMDADGVPGCSIVVCTACDSDRTAKVWREVDAKIMATIRDSDLTNC